MAACASASSLLVVLPIADTTTIGWRPARALTIAATRSMAAADSTEVPPNFITITSPNPWRRHSCLPGRDSSRPMPIYSTRPTLIQQPFRVHQLRIQNGRTRRAPNRVVAQRNELPVEYRARPQTADERCHPALALRILARLGTVRLRHILHRPLRR